MGLGAASFVGELVEAREGSGVGVGVGMAADAGAGSGMGSGCSAISPARRPEWDLGLSLIHI